MNTNATLHRTARYGHGLMVAGRTPAAFAEWREQLRKEMEAVGRQVAEINDVLSERVYR